MKFSRLGIFAALFAVSAFAAETANPYRASGNTHRIAVTNVASVAEQLTAFSPDVICTQFALHNLGATDAYVALGSTAAAVAAVDIPAAGVPASGILVKAGASLVVGGPSQAYISAKTASSTTTLDATCGIGNISGIGGTSVGASVPPTGASATQVQGTAADGATAVGSPVQTGGVDGSGNAQSFLTATDGTLKSGVKTVSGPFGDSGSNTGNRPLDADGNLIFTFNYPYVFNGTTWDRARGDTSGTFVQGPAAHDAPVAGNPVRMAGHARTSVISAVANDDTVDWTFTTTGLPALAHKSGGADAQNNSLGSVLGSSDGTNQSMLMTYPMIFNGTTWDRARAAGIGNNVASTGIAAAADYGQYTTLANQPALTTGNYAAAQLDSVANTKVVPGAPAIGNILAGRQTFTSTTGATTLITITAGKTFIGTLGSSVTCTEAAAGVVACGATATFTTVGASITPAAGTYFVCDARGGANAATGTVGSQGNNFCSEPFIASCASGTCTIAVASTNAGTSSLVEAYASGVMQ